ncbi:DUF2339 domain-containing protein [Sinomicrobium weinanense]|uniref:DUF2339 domain-containing protein n=1 Tax=Sinomicrobium weinanense TaxID=2842200 RepID=A0A926JRV7_9FLAO|nr:DUF2339 domain-containing protein [Sinomicrobium weinanense]MBC9796143.1 DUF2339 domain-containing protein [Sinomicrobium weinanense]MBU3121894.1 DUF2339 domain-containing protein [Sinomicrobium weinanense]
MTYFLLIIILVFLIVLLNRISSGFKKTEQELQDLSEKLETLQKQKTATTSTVQESIPSASKDLQKPVEEAKKNDPEPIPEKPVPITGTIPGEKKNRPVEPVSFSATKPKAEPSLPRKSQWEKFKEKNPDMEKFIGENLINKIGILILVLGIVFFVKYAIDKNWINETARVGIGILAGAIVMFFAHRLRKRFKAFSSVLVAGAISIFYFTIAIAYHEYQLFSQAVAFSIMVVITAFNSLVSVSYNRMELAVLALIGGFSVPFMVSTGEGNYITLFTYITILNFGILAIAYFKKWNLVTILSFLFTVILYGSWMTNELFNNSLPYSGAFIFATIFYVMFSIIAIIHNLRKKGALSVADYIVLLGNNLFYFSAGLTILSHWNENMQGVFTISLALFNLAYTAVLYKKFGLDRNAVYLFLGLTLTFVTLTVPIQFEGNYITMFWAAEVVLLFWLSQKSGISTFKAGAIIVQGLMFISLLMDWVDYYVAGKAELSVILNRAFITGLISALSYAGVYFLLRKENNPEKIGVITFDPRAYSTFAAILAVVVAYITGMLETIYQAHQFLYTDDAALSCSVLYHYICSALLLFFNLRSQHTMLKKLTLSLAALNILLYVLLFSHLPTAEFLANLTMEHSEHIAFYLHYGILLCLAYFIKTLITRTIHDPVIPFFREPLVLWLLAFCIVFILSYEVMIHSLYLTPGINTPQGLQDAKIQIVKIGYPILWGILSFVFLITGIKRQWKLLRIIALSLLGITVLKLFIYDIKNVSETGKIIAFILLGILILVISFVYQKIKKLVIDDPATKPQSDEEKS